MLYEVSNFRKIKLRKRFNDSLLFGCRTLIMLFKRLNLYVADTNKHLKNALHNPPY